MVLFLFVFLGMIALVIYGQYLFVALLNLPLITIIPLVLLLFFPFYQKRLKIPFGLKRIGEIISYIYMGAQLYFIPLLLVDQLIAIPSFVYWIAVIIVVYGIYNANRIVVKEYRIDAPINQQITLISDIHLGYQIGKKEFARMIERVNALKSEYVMIAGDLCDMDLDVVIEQNLLPILDQLQGKVYMVMGNHDNYTRQVDLLKKEIGKTKVILLDDESVELDDFTLIGRNDSQFSKKTLKEYTKGNYTIVMDHTPSRISESIDEKIDLHLSGHTHNGQLFPLQLITNTIFKVGYGYKRIQDTNIVVSGGIGYWGPMNKSSGPCEIALLKLGKE